VAGRKQDRLAAMAEAEAVPAPDFAAAEDAPDEDGPAPHLPAPCPVTPLGVNGKSLVFLDGLNQIQTAPTKCDKGDLMLWFGNDYLEAHYATEGKERWDQRKAQVALVEDCRNLGIFNPKGRVFGRGAHRGPNGGRELVLHMGGRVVVADPAQRREQDKLTVSRAGAVTVGGERLFYPALPSLTPPAPRPATANEAHDLMATFEQFYWVEPDAAPLVLTGMVAQMFICGALRWRSHAWIVSPTGSGKTTLQTIIREMLGNWCLHTEDASEAAIRQVLNDDTLPVLVDEAEPHDKQEKLQALLNLMKKASSGAKIHRGGADHKAQEFTAQSCFLLSSVLHAPLRGEDRNRLAILEMRKVPDNAPPLELEMATWRTMGRKLHRRMIEHWPRWDETYEAYKRAIAGHGFEGRHQDTFGTLLACADLLLYDHGVHHISSDSAAPGRERVAQAVAIVRPMMERARSEARSDVERVLLHLASSMLPGSNGNPPEPVGLWIERAMELVHSASEDPSAFETAPVINEKARAKLKSHGLRVVSLTQKPDQRQPSVSDPPAEDWRGSYLAVAYASNTPLCELFKGSDWAGGAWVQSLGKIEGVQKAKVRFAGSLDNAVCVPLHLFEPKEGE
jgi:hypothetical protein